ncbi:phosphotriesterase family protein [Rhodococcus opacus]|uniref:Phosphotriesterase-related protein n=1 Tax=Rhodococcus opacus TaxID=37919 RepID=A0A2S8IBK9_RHOOP|nr:phosphotriesterase [Rhodococcus opacus]PQP12174.1 phosphotriesterase-related protein [Rhodococcus opacus]
MTIQTAKGPIELDALGKVLAHEHVFALSEDYRQNYAPDWNEDAAVDEAVDQLEELKSLGIDTILDPTVLGLGRYIPRIQRVADRTSLNIIVATGVYTYQDVPFQFHHSGPGLMFDRPEPMVDLFVTDLIEGIANTGVRAAFLKCAIDEPGLTPGVERVMRAVGQASVRTGAPITVHTNPHNESGLVAQRVLSEEGVDLSRVVIGHSGDTTDLGYLMKVADAGSILGMDRFGLDVLLPFDDRVNTIAELVRRGYGDRMVIAHDASCAIDWFSREEKTAAAPNWNYRHISQDVLPALLDRGLNQDDLDQILVRTPLRYFEPAN